MSAAECRSILADGSVMTICATRRERAGRADVKCAGAGGPQLAERMQQVVRLARLTEPRFDSRDQVLLTADRAPAPHERDWELAAVLADRMARGVLPPQPGLAANGWSDEWHLGRVGGHAHGAGREGLLLGGPGGVTHLGALHGQSCASGAVSGARAWFPLHSGGINDSLCWVEVSVYPLAAPAGEEEDTIAVPGLDVTGQLAVRQALAAARRFDARAEGRWRTAVRFGQPRFHGKSYELALVVADRMARGREFLARGRVIATGCSSAWQSGRVDTVEGLAPKCALILAQAAPGDRILLPRAWEAGLDAGFAAAVKAKGASMACIEHIGLP
ncbi:hypothetical protein [Massilia cavernae]|uniref:Uncharacterized protein n=1 Tax=Massilia cavernae TaxID=2320864 RepID=A0A418Y136_9BURK|nr:hypothetical protein [Massilia cavernae]RJG19189.1 hypothetical protein D3872_08790 [Massilia cavernae]